MKLVHALNAALLGVLRPGDAVVRTEYDHNSVRRPVSLLRGRAYPSIEDLDPVPLPLCPARIHAHQHLRPVLGLCAAGASADLDLGVPEVIRAAEQ